LSYFCLFIILILLEALAVAKYPREIKFQQHKTSLRLKLLGKMNIFFVCNHKTIKWHNMRLNISRIIIKTGMEFTWFWKLFLIYIFITRAEISNQILCQKSRKIIIYSIFTQIVPNHKKIYMKKYRGENFLNWFSSNNELNFL
jgi:hypothetical protein